MAVANLDTKKITAGYQDQTLQLVEETALDGTDGGEFTVTAPEGRFVLLIHNSDASNNETVTIKAPAKPMMRSWNRIS